MTLFRLDRNDPLSFGAKFPEIFVEWIAPLKFRIPIVRGIPVSKAQERVHSTKISSKTQWIGLVQPKKTGPPFEVDNFSRLDLLEFWLNGSRPRIQDSKSKKLVFGIPESELPYMGRNVIQCNIYTKQLYLRVCAYESLIQLGRYHDY